MPDEFVVKIANLRFCGIDSYGSRKGRELSAELLKGADVALLQELWAPDAENEDAVWREVWNLAGLTGLSPVAIGQPRGDARLRTGIMINPETFKVLKHGPEPSLETPYWTEATLESRSGGRPLDVYSVHAPASNAQGQVQEAQRLATRVARRRLPAMVGGDWNCYTTRDQFTLEQLEQLPRHLRPSRLRRVDGKLTVRLDVQEALELGGLVDPVPFLPPGKAKPPHLLGTGSEPIGIIDRLLVTEDTVRAVLWHEVVDNPGSDHKQLWFGIDPAVLWAGG